MEGSFTMKAESFEFIFFLSLILFLGVGGCKPTALATQDDCGGNHRPVAVIEVSQP